VAAQRPQAECPTRYHKTITLNGTPSIQAAMYRIEPSANGGAISLPPAVVAVAPHH
jgi:hypothetical protein